MQVWIRIYSVIILPFPSHLVVPSPTLGTYRLTHAKGKNIWWLSLRGRGSIKGEKCDGQLMPNYSSVGRDSNASLVGHIFTHPISQLLNFHFMSFCSFLEWQQVYMFIFIYELKILPIFFGIFQLRVCLRENPFSSLRKSGLWNSLLLTR